MSPGSPVFWTKAQTARGPIRVPARFLFTTNGGQAVIAIPAQRESKVVPPGSLLPRADEVSE